MNTAAGTHHARSPVPATDKPTDQPSAEETADDLVRRARDHWWAGDIAGSIRLGEQAHQRLVAEGRVVEGADQALRVGLQCGTRGDLTLATAWFARADRLLRDEPTCAVHGYSRYARATAELLFYGDPSGTPEAVGELTRLAGQYADPALDCFALTLTGIADVLGGDVGGFSALDEAMIPVLGGGVDPLWGGDIFCTVIHVCEALGDLARMRSWTDTLAGWSAPLSSTFLYAGVTRIHQLQLLRAEGEWDQVERELEDTSAGLADAHGWIAGAGFYELGEVHRLRGRDDEARAAYARARSLAHDPQPGEAELMHAGGDTAGALTTLRASLAERDPLDRARVIGAAVDIALAAGEATYAASLADELEQTARHFGTPGLLAAAAQARAACLVHDGDHAGAMTRLEEAARIHREQRHRHALARTHEAFAVAHRGLGDTARAEAAQATARAIYQRLGAQADLRRLEASRRPAGLTAREVEVLVHVSAGLTNKEVAGALVISDKTVSRHLASIFLKIDVSSRTAAAAWAREHGLV